MENTPLPPERYMKYPYTMTAKVIMFPYKHYWKHAWFMRYWTIGLAITGLVFMKIGSASYAPANVEKWAEVRRKMFHGDPDHHH